MTIKTLQKIIDFAEGGKLMSVVADGNVTEFIKHGSFAYDVGADSYSISSADGILQVNYGDSNYFFDVKKISTIEFIC